MLVKYQLPFKYLLKFIYLDTAIVFAVSVFVFFFVRKVDFPIIPLGIPTFMGTAISLLLAFKLGQSYDRWWEARKVWGAIVNDSRSLALQVLNYHKEGKCEQTERMTMRQIAFAHSLGQSLRGLSPSEGIDQFLSKEELEKVCRHKNVPLALINEHSADLKDMYEARNINEYQQIQIDQTLVRLVASMGKAERIKNTVFPTSYRYFLHSFIYFFIVLMAIALAEIDRLWEIPMLVSISLPFFMLEKTSTYLQDPFENRPTDTSVTAIAKTIETNLKQLLDRGDLPNPQPVEDYYVM